MSSDTYADTDDYVVGYDDGVGAATIEWKRFVTGEPFREGMETLLDCIDERNAAKELADSREIKSLDDEDIGWMMGDWIPKAMDAGLESIAVVYPESVIAEMNLERIAEQGADMPVEQMITKDMDEARRWLQNQ
jgi:hypothetical protein